MKPKKGRLRIWYDREADFLELRTTPKPTKGYFQNLGNEVFARIDSKTKKVVGFTVFNLTKHFPLKKHTELPLPLKAEIQTTATA